MHFEHLGLWPENSGVYAGEWVQNPSGGRVESYNPATMETLGYVLLAGQREYEAVVKSARDSFLSWRAVPAPKRGEIIREIGEKLRQYKSDLGKIVSLESGKILSEGEGEVQEMIDICDFAVGLSRQLCGSAMHSERPEHRMYEQWHPLGPVGVITAFNFPVAVWAWNAMIAAVCGNSVIWKPSRETPLSAIATQYICSRVLKNHGFPGVFNLLIGDSYVVGERLLADRRIPLISATGSCVFGRHVAEVVGKRLGKTILELGGNNAVIVLNDADINLALRAIVFGAVGTAGQRCTSTRRVIMQKGWTADELTRRLLKAYAQIKVGDPLDPETLMGPLINAEAVYEMKKALRQAVYEGGKILCGGNVLEDRPGFFVEPTIVRAHRDMEIVREETFAPILYLLEAEILEEAIAIQNDVPQGLSSAIFTDSVRSAEIFLSARGSDCGIANINIGTSGAEIGGAFGGEKDTGGGREAGSDAWKAYMRRQTCTINFSSEMPLAQGVVFGKS